METLMSLPSLASCFCPCKFKDGRILIFHDKAFFVQMAFTVRNTIRTLSMNLTFSYQGVFQAYVIDKTMVMQTFNLSTWEAEASEFLQV